MKIIIQFHKHAIFLFFYFWMTSDEFKSGIQKADFPPGKQLTHIWAKGWSKLSCYLEIGQLQLRGWSFDQTGMF